MTDKIETRPPTSASSGQRGPAEHERREQILKAADDHFRHYGYGKTTVGDVAKTIGLSTAYIYKFFDSKQAIGEAVCRQCLTGLVDDAREIARESKPAADRLRRVFLSLAHRGAEQFFTERKLHDIALTATQERWPVVLDYKADVLEIIKEVVLSGRESGEFERKTLIDETCGAIHLTMASFLHPVLLEEDLDTLEEKAVSVANLVLRSLAP